MPSIEHHLAILGVTKKASTDDIRKAWLKKVKSNHPDRGGDHDTLVAINAAYEVLKNGVPAEEKLLHDVPWDSFKPTVEDSYNSVIAQAVNKHARDWMAKTREKYKKELRLGIEVQVSEHRWMMPDFYVHFWGDIKVTSPTQAELVMDTRPIPGTDNYIIFPNLYVEGSKLMVQGARYANINDKDRLESVTFSMNDLSLKIRFSDKTQPKKLTASDKKDWLPTVIWSDMNGLINQMRGFTPSGQRRSKLRSSLGNLTAKVL
jgi:hypothetical protein